MRITATVCSYQPDEATFATCLSHLRQQTLATDKWEAVIVTDEGSTRVVERLAKAHLPQARCIVEAKPGILPARLRSFQESRGELCVIVDDDNFLHPDFLEKTLEHAERWPQLGAWGGHIRPEFVETPPPWTRPFWGDLAIYEFDKPRWGNVKHAELSPRGAGMTIRREVAKAFQQFVSNHPVHGEVGRMHRDPSSIGGEDTEIGLVALREGWGLGNFPDLELTHRLPPARLTEDYLKKMAFGMAKSWTLINWLWGMGGAYSRRGLLKRTVDGLRLCSGCSGPARRVRFASWKGTGAGIRLIERLKGEGVAPFTAPSP